MANNTERSFPLLGVLASVVLCLLVAVFVWILWPSNAEPVKPRINTVPLVEEPVIPVPVEDIVEEAVEEEIEETQPEPEAEPLPRLNESDESLKSTLTELNGGSALLALLVDAELIRKSVRAVHSLSEGWVVKEYRPVQSPKGRFTVTDTGRLDKDNLRIYETSSANYQRYERYINTLTKFSPESAAQAYRKFYPLLQQAYEELGLRDGDFHSVMLAALDQLLSAPTFSADQTLLQPSVMYVYADKNVENLSSLEKLKLRIGPENTVALRSWAREFRLVIADR